MRYRNATKVLPNELIEQIQQYVQGEYIYIPIKDREVDNNITEYAIEIQKRDERIYTKHLEGMKNVELAEKYSLSESSIRRIIIKQRKGYKEMKNYVSEILFDWDIEDVDIEQIYDSVWQVGDRYVLKVYDNLNMLERNIKVLSILYDLGIPVGHLIANNKGVIYSKDEHYYYILSERLKGSNIVSTSELEKLSYKMGKIIADLHNAFLECEQQADFWENSLLLEMKGWIRDIFIKNEWVVVDKKLYDDTLLNLEQLYDTLPVQLIHRDVHFGNFLFDKDSFSGYIDFDLSQRNIRIFDLCYFVLGLLSEEETIVITKEKWFDVLKNVFKGYNEVNELLQQEINAVPYVMKAIELLFVAWFLNQNDKRCSENALEIFNFINNNTERIENVLRM